MQRGYTFVMVDLRGFGGSSGCLDWGGPGEQSDVVSSVNWLASRSWSNGRVGMYGKSYDGVTGLVGVNKRPAGLKAVVAQEPVYDLYRYLYGDGIRRLNSAATPALYNLINLTPGPALGQPALLGQRRGRPHPPRLQRPEPARPDGRRRPQLALLAAAQPDPRRRRARRCRCSSPRAPPRTTRWPTAWPSTCATTPATSAPGWARGSTCAAPRRARRTTSRPAAATSNVGRLKMGRAGFFDEVMRFYDRFLKGAKTTRRPPARAADQRRHLARRGRLAAERLARPEQPVPHRQLHRRRRRLRHRHGHRAACGRSPSRCPTPPTWPARAARP